mmetsp:Transcript_23285/g.41325  ORF Transcript_23285/g.41325 Transcript_23285/m.41325 type:complete len:327 (-) Transcript_23285:394-1374(-)|eukprot:CAMPEP_0175052922 /NCGR_PEP_ID=MMETSP0052_2-20121109/8629_1 /TAXON_ID=51329 ORGANISM="Polytomella parva, Strain SAG 63-3" /NCGR_SAMPLE_ID=MMETSP0052_2 /ASSEMBLY_ACC=CAM_ASM_000194 /LENGTH=326 /DNA_ID=CAMNT_0016317381 /DNA_START=47 /DNA_END=1027 /DNA_ORIENTATION=-
MEENAEAPKAVRAGRRAGKANIEAQEGNSNEDTEDPPRSFMPRQGGLMEGPPSSSYAEGEEEPGIRNDSKRRSSDNVGASSNSNYTSSNNNDSNNNNNNNINNSDVNSSSNAVSNGGNGTAEGNVTAAPGGRRRDGNGRPVVSFAAAVDDPLADDGDDKKFSGVSRRKQEQIAKSDETVRRNKKYDEATENVLDIPELEDEGKEDISNVVAEAPKVCSNKVQGMEELEEETTFRLPTTGDRDMDLSLLTAVLCLAEQVREGDEIWDPELLLGEVASELNAEKEKAEAADAPVSGDAASTAINPIFEAESQFTAGGGSAMTSSARVP